jgi:hypothetical protein
MGSKSQYFGMISALCMSLLTFHWLKVFGLSAGWGMVPHYAHPFLQWQGQDKAKVTE